MPGSITETYHAAIQHDLVDVGDATLVGVVRQPAGWFRDAVDENHPELGPPDALLEETKRRTEDLKRAGMCDEGAHNAAWEDVEFADRYLTYIEESEDAQSCLQTLRERITAGEDVALVCFEGDGKRCHRRLLVEELQPEGKKSRQSEQRNRRGAPNSQSER